MNTREGRAAFPQDKLPERISRLGELAYNLWWSWNEDARELFRLLDYRLWRLSGHNVVKQLREISPEKLKAAANDPAFLAHYDLVMKAFGNECSATDTWFVREHPRMLPGPIAYFSAEFALHSSLPIYAGGLGVLAGDLLKEGSDLGVPMVAIGFMYPQGYFHQHVSPDGWQEEIYRQLDFDEAPISPCPGPTCGPLAQVNLGDRTLYLTAWRVHVGCVELYLLDTNIEENAPWDRQLSARLYTADREQRIQQEIALGIGGVRVLRKLGINPSIWHGNEGHTSFMMVERVREEVEKGASFDQALHRVQETSVFTTHTPVPAGHDVFPIQFVDRYLGRFWEGMGTDRETFLRLGRQDTASAQVFNMTVLGLRLAKYRNAVSKLHGEVTRRMWHVLWPEVREQEVPITYVTNGVHVPTWIGAEIYDVYERHLGKDLPQKYDDVTLIDKVRGIPDEELWTARQEMKRKLIAAIAERAQERWTSGEATAQQIIGMGALLTDSALTIAFCRRFTEYKRPALIFSDIERLKRIVKNRWQPVQIIFTGKSHPADFVSKHLLHRVYNLANDREFLGRIAFIEDYDMHIARYLVQGVDVWLNVPRRLQEASGTSGMKAAINGVLNLSVRDGWWYEGYNGKNGWKIGPDSPPPDPAEEDRLDAESIYQLLENDIVPLFYDQDRRGVPHRWLHMVKESIGSIVPVFSARRMLKQYVDGMYIPAAQSLDGDKTLK